MPELLIKSSDAGKSRRLSIDQEAITVGRDSTNDLCLPHLSVSNFHAVIIPENGGVILKDLKSTNGTKVNGERIQKQVLVHLDDITIGKYKISYVETRIGNYRLSHAETSTEPVRISNATRLPPAMRKNWIAIQKKFDYPVNALGIKIESSNTKAMEIWKTENIDEEGRLLIG